MSSYYKMENTEFFTPAAILSAPIAIPQIHSSLFGLIAVTGSTNFRPHCQRKTGAFESGATNFEAEDKPDAGRIANKTSLSNYTEMCSRQMADRVAIARRGAKSTDYLLAPLPGSTRTVALSGATNLESLAAGHGSSSIWCGTTTDEAISRNPSGVSWNGPSRRINDHQSVPLLRACSRDENCMAFLLRLCRSSELLAPTNFPHDETGAVRTENPLTKSPGAGTNFLQSDNSGLQLPYRNRHRHGDTPTTPTRNVGQTTCKDSKVVPAMKGSKPPSAYVN